MKKEEIREMIREYRMELATRNGREGVLVTGPRLNQKQVELVKKNRDAFIAELKAMKAEEEAKKEAKEAAEWEALKTGETKITVHYHDGEYLSGYTVHGKAALLLKELGLAKWVSGWGYRVDELLVEALGKEFTYPQAVEYNRLAEEEKARKKAEKEAALQEKFDEAKATGKPVIIRKYTVPCEDPREECNMDIVTEYAMPDGSIKRTQHHTW